jgi:hypothetical protein
MSEERIECAGLAEALSFLDKRGAEALDGLRTYRHNVKELTGHDPDKPVTALDVVRIVQRVFFPRETVTCDASDLPQTAD